MSRNKLYEEANTKLVSAKVNINIFKKIELAARELRITPSAYIRRCLEHFVGDSMMTNGGHEARYTGQDEFSRDLYQIFVKDHWHTLVDVDGKLHTMSVDGEPISAVKDEYQLKGK